MQRVSVFTLIYFFGRSIIQLAKQATNFIPLAVIIFAASDEFRGLLLATAVVLIPLALLLHATLSWYFFKYQHDEQRLIIHSGILKRSHVSLDYARVQSADVRQPWYFRPLGLAVLGVESAGSEDKEVELAGITQQHAESLKEQMFTVAKQASGGTISSDHEPNGSGTADESSNTAPEFTLSLGELTRHGLMHNPILLALPFLAYPLSQGDLLDDFLDTYVVELVQSFSQLEQAGTLWVLGIAAVMALALGLIALSVVIAIVRFFAFRLTIVNEQSADQPSSALQAHGTAHQQTRFEAKFGLLSVSTRTFQYIRMQRVVVQQGLIARWIKRYSMRINQSGQVRQAQQKAFFIPVLSPPRLARMSEHLGLCPATWRRTHKASMLMPLLISVGFAGGAAYLIFDFSLKAAAHGAWVSALVAGAVQWQLWRRRAFFVNDEWFAVRRGLLGQQQRWVPAHKIQAMTLREGPWLRAWGMVSLQVYSAAGRETLSWVPAGELAATRDKLLLRTSQFQGRWM